MSDETAGYMNFKEILKLLKSYVPNIMELCIRDVAMINCEVTGLPTLRSLEFSKTEWRDGKFNLDLPELRALRMHCDVSGNQLAQSLRKCGQIQIFVIMATQVLPALYLPNCQVMLLGTEPEVYVKSAKLYLPRVENLVFKCAIEEIKFSIKIISRSLRIRFATSCDMLTTSSSGLLYKIVLLRCAS